MAADIRGDGLAVLKFDAVKNILSAYCRYPAHGKFCRVNRTLNARATRPWQGKCGGLLLAWIDCASNFATAREHQAITFPDRILITPFLQWHRRRDCRRWAYENAPVVRDFLAEHEPPGPKVPNADADEPAGV